MYPPFLQMETRRRLAEEWLAARDARRYARKQAVASFKRRMAVSSEPATDAITIRLSTPEDRNAILRLAALDSRRAPSGESILAIVGGELRAALPLGGGEPIADPFWPTTELVELLRVRDAALHGTGTGHGQPLRARLALARR